MSGALLHLAKLHSATAGTADVADVVRAMLDAQLDPSVPWPVLVAQSAHILRRSLQFDVCGAYWVAPDRPASLTLAASEGLPPEFADVARSLPLSDYDQVADLPYNDDHGSCYGDFFAPVVGAFGVHSWLVSSLTNPDTHAVLGAVLLGARDGKRFDSAETRTVQALAAHISLTLSIRYPQEDIHGLASLDQAA